MAVPRAGAGAWESWWGPRPRKRAHRRGWESHPGPTPVARQLLGVLVVAGAAADRVGAVAAAQLIRAGAPGELIGAVPPDSESTIAGNEIPNATSGICTANDSACICRACSR